MNRIIVLMPVQSLQ